MVFRKLNAAARHRLALWREVLRLRHATHYPPVRLVVGSGGIAPAGWIATEASYLNLLIDRHWQRCFRPASLDAILAEHVWEHLSAEQGQQAAYTCFRYLRPGGRLRIAVPDGNHPDRSYFEWVRPGGSGPGADDHKVLYTHETLTTLLKVVGFAIEPLEWFDNKGTFQFREWDSNDGLILRSLRHDKRNSDGCPHYTSLIVDAIRPMGSH